MLRSSLNELSELGDALVDSAANHQLGAEGVARVRKIMHRLAQLWQRRRVVAGGDHLGGQRHPRPAVRAPLDDLAPERDPASCPVSGLKSHIQICVGSVAFDVQISRLPSGEKPGRSFVICSWIQPPRFTTTRGKIHKCEVLVFAARSTSWQSNTTHLPSGDGTGAPTRLSFIMSSNVNGCFGGCAGN